jgi:hypothetical protein
MTASELAELEVSTLQQTFDRTDSGLQSSRAPDALRAIRPGHGSVLLSAEGRVGVKRWHC